MQHKKIIIAGGTGFIGAELIKYFGKNNAIVVLTRSLPDETNNRNGFDSLRKEDRQTVSFIHWDGKTCGDWYSQLDNAGLLINLAGKTVNCRYNKKNKAAILNSRVQAVQALGEAIRQCKNPPPLWINASSATIYRHAMDKPQDEFTGEMGSGFSVEVCKAWEKALFDQHTPATRKVALRMAITLGPGGVLIPYFNLLKFGLGGKQGSGQQRFSWVHTEDTCRMIAWLAANPELEGVFNCSSPNPVLNTELMKTFKAVTGKRIGLPAPAWMLKIGAAIIGTETELVLKSRWVLPTKAQQYGFTFKYPLLQDALRDIIGKVPRRQYQLF